MQMKALAYRVRWGLALVLALGVWLLMQPLTAWACGGGVICVNVDAPAGGDGQSWGTAYPSLHTALSVASAGNEIWVAEGTYYPGASGSRTATFQLVSGVAVYGGFAGTESSRDARNWTANVTALSGDLDTSGDHTNNDAYHVVTGSGVTTTAVLDGFTITGGYANGSGASSDGAGVYNNAGSPTLANLVVTANAGTHDGGGVININSSSPSLDHVILSDNSAASGGGMINLNGSNPTLTHVIFSSNAASAYGGGMRNYNNSHPTLTDVTFSTNTSANGGAMVNDNSSPTMIDVTFQSNTATGNGGGMLNASSSHPTLTHVAFDSNTSVNAAGGGVFNDTNSHPTFVNVTFAGNNAATFGGGMYSRTSNYTFTGGSFSGNTAQWGGGMVNNNNTSSLSNVTFSNNTALTAGGGMYNYEGGHPSLVTVSFSGNTAPNGGGMYNTASSPALTNVILRSNTASSSGGGIYNTGSSPSLVNVAMLFNTAQNFGGGMENLNGSSPTLVNVTLAYNSAGRYGGGMDNYFSSSPVLTNTILWGNDATGGAQLWNSGSSVPVIASSDVQGAYAGGSWDSALGIDGGGNLDADPLFGAQSAYPPAGSPVLDIGAPAALPADSYDLDGDGVLTETLPLDLEGGERIWGAGLDLGAYEFRIWYVDADAAPGNGCTAWADACPDLQTALALPPGEIWVAEGVYSPGISGTMTATFQLHNGQALYGGFAGTEAERAQRDWVTHAVTLTGDLDGSESFTAGDAYHVVTTRSTDRSVVLDGFTITGGNAPNVGGCDPRSVDGVCQGGGLINWYGNPTLTNLVIHRNQAFAGGGVFSRDGSPLLTNVTFIGNSASYGGGMYSYGGSPVLTEVVFSSNSGAYRGGGLWGYGVTLTDATFIGNSASYGGGMYGNGTLTQVTFESNSASSYGGGMYSFYELTLTDGAFHSNTAGSGGGGLYISSGNGVLSNVTFSSNSTSGSGGGVNNRGARSIIFTNVTFNGNTAGDRGGGLYNDSTQGSVALDSVVLANVVFSGNAAAHGGGMYHSGFSSNPGSVALTNVTLSHNTASGTGGGIRLAEYAISRLNNTILWGNDAPDGAQINIGTPITATVASSNIQGSGGSGVGWDASLGADLGGSIDADPQFVSPIITTTMVPTTTGDYRLLAASPAIDVGDNNAVPAGVTTDLAGNPRIHNGVVDMGAYEASCTLVLSHSVTPTIDVPYHGIVTYTIVLSNTGATDDPAVTLTDTLPASVAFGQWVEQPGSSLVQNGSSFTWSGALAAGGGITLTFTATHTGDYGEVVTNTAHFSGTQQTGSAAVQFQVIPAYVITPTAGAGGSITPDTPQTVAYGSDLVFTIAPAAGYHISNVTVDGVSVGITTTYTFGDVTADHTLSATFALNIYIITPTVGAGGSISPATPQTVSHGDDITLPSPLTPAITSRTCWWTAVRSAR